MGQGESALDRCARGYSQRDHVLDRETGEIDADYEMGRKLGDGQFGEIRQCRHRFSGEQFACKSIKKSSLLSAEDFEDVRREIDVMERVVSHPNVVELKAVYEDEEWLHLVMELCEGGELFDYINENKQVSEQEAALVCKTLMDVLKHCHSRGVIHRDLKPENILLSQKNSLFPLKVADFGLAVNAYEGEKFSGMAGSAYYIAPEVLKGSYGAEIDVWSVGVIVYILLSGTPPFWDKTDEGIFKAITHGHLDLSSGPWPSFSAEVKDLLKGMLCSDVKQRLTPEQVSNHEWILRFCESQDAESASEGSSSCSTSSENAFMGSRFMAEEEAAMISPLNLTGCTGAACSPEDSGSAKWSSEVISQITGSTEVKSEVSVQTERKTTSAASHCLDSAQSLEGEESEGKLKESIRCTNAADSPIAVVEDEPLSWNSIGSKHTVSVSDDVTSDSFLANVVSGLGDMSMSPFHLSTPVPFQASCNFDMIKSSWEENKIMAEARYHVGEISVRP